MATNTPKPHDPKPGDRTLAERKAAEAEVDHDTADDKPKLNVAQALHELATTGRLGDESQAAIAHELDLPDFGAEGAKASGPPPEDDDKS